MIQQEKMCTISMAASAFSPGARLCTWRQSSSDRPACGAEHVVASAEQIVIYTPELAVGLLPAPFWAHREFEGIILISVTWLGVPFYHADCEKKNVFLDRNKGVAFNIVLEIQKYKKD
jgi:hypothetical protein